MWVIILSSDRYSVRDPSLLELTFGFDIATGRISGSVPRLTIDHWLSVTWYLVLGTIWYLVLDPWSLISANSCYLYFSFPDLYDILDQILDTLDQFIKFLGVNTFPANIHVYPKVLLSTRGHTVLYFHSRRLSIFVPKVLLLLVAMYRPVYFHRRYYISRLGIFVF